jgi:hypothetical protein
MNFRFWLENNDIARPFVGSTVQQLVYHGTDKSPFKQFAYQKSQRFVLFAQFDVEAKGFFFSESPHDALEFGQNVVACYIDLKNPLLDPRRDKHLGVDSLPYAKEIDLMKVLAPLIEKDDSGASFVDLGVERYYLKNRRLEKPRDWIYYAVTSMGLNWDALDNPGVVQRMQQLGYDGTFVAEPHTWLGRSIFVPSADQVRMVKWVKGAQAEWGEKEDWNIKKKDGIYNLERS